MTTKRWVYSEGKCARRVPMWRMWLWRFVRFQVDAYGQTRTYRWLWTPVTSRFGHGGWIFLSVPWLWRFRYGPAPLKSRSVNENPRLSGGSRPR
jgi:hypothetical protein